MSLVQHITQNLGGVISVQPMSRPANALVTVYNDDGAIKVNNVSAVVSGISTVLTNAVNARAKVITLQNATAVAERSAFAIGSPTEWVRAKTVSGNQVTLWHPLREAHGNNASVYSTLCTYNVAANACTATWFDGRARWEFPDEIKYTGIECTMYPLARTATELDVYAVNSDFGALLSATEDPETALDAAHDFVLEQLGAKGRARVFPASTEFNRCVAIAFARNHYLGQSTEAAQRKFEQYSKEFELELALLQSSLTPDENQDGVIEGAERRAQHSFRMDRGG